MGSYSEYSSFLLAFLCLCFFPIRFGQMNKWAMRIYSRKMKKEKEKKKSNLVTHSESDESMLFLFSFLTNGNKITIIPSPSSSWCVTKQKMITKKLYIYRSNIYGYLSSTDIFLLFFFSFPKLYEWMNDRIWCFVCMTHIQISGYH